MGGGGGWFGQVLARRAAGAGPGARSAHLPAGLAHAGWGARGGKVRTEVHRQSSSWTIFCVNFS